MQLPQTLTLGSAVAALDALRAAVAAGGGGPLMELWAAA